MAKISEIMLLKQVDQPALVIESVTDMAGLPNLIGESFGKIANYLSLLDETTTDIPFVAYVDYENMNENHIPVMVGLKTAKLLAAKDDINSVIIPARKIVSCLHRGGYDELAALYIELAAWIEANDYKGTGTSVEYYCTGPGFPEAEQVTRVEMPLK